MQHLPRLSQGRNQGKTKCGKAHLTNLRIWSNARHLTNCATFGKSRARLTNWSNALRDCPNAQIGQMRLTKTLIHFTRLLKINH